MAKKWVFLTLTNIFTSHIITLWVEKCVFFKTCSGACSEFPRFWNFCKKNEKILDLRGITFRNFQNSWFCIFFSVSKKWKVFFDGFLKFFDEKMKFLKKNKKIQNWKKVVSENDPDYSINYICTDFYLTSSKLIQTMIFKTEKTCSKCSATPLEIFQKIWKPD